MPWLGKAIAVLEGYLGGLADGSAVVDILLSKVNPSGKLTETLAPFAYTDKILSSPRISNRELLMVSIRMRNTGKVAGIEIIQHWVT